MRVGERTEESGDGQVSAPVRSPGAPGFWGRAAGKRICLLYGGRQNWRCE